MAANTTHSLNALKRNEAILNNMAQLMNSVSLEKLEKIQEIIQKELEEWMEEKEQLSGENKTNPLHFQEAGLWVMVYSEINSTDYTNLRHELSAW